MVKKKKANGSGTTKPNIAKLKETYVGRYVNTPLSFWDDGVTSVKKGSSVEMVLGKITTVKMAKKKNGKSYSGCSLCANGRRGRHGMCTFS